MRVGTRMLRRKEREGGKEGSMRKGDSPTFSFRSALASIQAVLFCAASRWPSVASTWRLWVVVGPSTIISDRLIMGSAAPEVQVSLGSDDDGCNLREPRIMQDLVVDDLYHVEAVPRGDRVDQYVAVYSNSML